MHQSLGRARCVDLVDPWHGRPAAGDDGLDHGPRCYWRRRHGGPVGGDELLGDSRFGGRVRVGSSLNACETVGFEASYLRLEEAGDGFAASNDDYTVLSRPIFNGGTSAQALTIALPGTTSGSLRIDAESDFDAIDATFLFNIFAAPGGACDFVAGYRRLELSESLVATQSTESLAGPTAGATTTLTTGSRRVTRSTADSSACGSKPGEPSAVA